MLKQLSVHLEKNMEEDLKLFEKEKGLDVSESYACPHHPERAWSCLTLEAEQVHLVRTRIKDRSVDVWEGKPVFYQSAHKIPWSARE